MLSASTDDFGHQPEPIYAPGPLGPGDDQQMCTRCRVGHDIVQWPCTSAIVLGLVPRPCSYCKGAKSDPDDLGDWIPEVGMYHPYSSAPCPECHGSGLAAQVQQ